MDRSWNSGRTSSVSSGSGMSLSLHSIDMEEWVRTQPLSVLQLSPADRVVCKVADERDAIQKKTFTKWVNKHLKNARDKRYVVVDLYKDLQSGENLLKLLELLSHTELRRERGNFRVHKIQNVETALRFLIDRKIKVVNIRPEDIVDGNSKLTLGLIWIIILHFQVSEPWGQEEGLSARDALLQWTQRVTQGYPGVHVKNFSNSWRDGLAFNAVLHRYNPRLVRWRDLAAQSNRDRLESAFATAEREFQVTRLLDAEDVDVDNPDERSLITYISSLYDALPDMPEFNKYEEDMITYNADAREWLNWVSRATRLMEDRHTPGSGPELRKLLTELDRFKSEDLPPRLREKDTLTQMYIELQELFSGSGQIQIDGDLAMDNLDRQWNGLLRAMEEREQRLRGGVGIASSQFTGIETQIGVVNEKLDRILERIEHAEANLKIAPPAEMKITLDRIVDDLEVLTNPIQNLFADVDQMKAQGHPEANNFYRLVLGLHQRQRAYLQRLNAQLLVELGYSTKIETERYESSRTNTFHSCEECIHWIDQRLGGLSSMEFSEELPVLETIFEQHKEDHRMTLDFRQEVDKCIARQAEVSADDSATYCDLLSTLESSYQQLRDLSTGRMLDLDSLIAFVRAAQAELVWISEREELEVARNWSDIGQLDLPMLQNYYKQLLHEIELREEQFNTVHNMGAALLNQGHPAVRVIEAYLTTMQAQWDWLLNLARCLETHLQDSLNLKLFMEESEQCEEWMERQTQLLDSHYNRSDFSLDEGEKMLKELEEIREMLNRYHEVLLTLIERSRILSPLWQRGERITKPTPAVALCDYNDREMIIHRGDECVLLDNSDLIRWHVRSAGGVEGAVPSVVFRLPPPDERLLQYLHRLQAQFERLKRLWLEKHLWVRFNMVLSTMHTIRSWDLQQFLAIDADQRDDIMKALNDDASKLLAELGPDDPLAIRLKEELRLANEHYLYLLQLSQKSNEPSLSDRFDDKMNGLGTLLEDAWKKLNDRVAKPVARDVDKLDLMINEHKVFEDGLQGLDSEVASLLELYQQLEDPSPMQRTRKEQLETRWDDLWVLSRMYVERLKALELVLNGMSEVDQIVREHEVTLGSFDKMPADVNKLRAVHSQLLELNMVLQQQQPILDDLALNVGQLRQHIARTRFNVTEHPDMDKLEDDVQRLTVRWENICQQVLDRLKSSEVGLQVLMVYRSDYKNEIDWLDRVEATINNLRDPRSLRAEEYQHQLDLLVAEYSQLQERTRAIEQVNNEGGKFIREAKTFDIRVEQYVDTVEEVFGPGLRSMLRRTQPTPQSGADKVTRELEELNRRFSQLSSIILERRNVIQVLIQNWRRQQQEDGDKRRADESARLRAEEEARRLGAEESERLRRLREEEEARRRAAEDEADRLRRLRDEEEARRRAEESQRWADDESRRRAEEEARRLAAEREARLRAEEEARRRAEEEARRRALEMERLRQKVQVDIAIQGSAPEPEPEPSTYRSRLHVSDAGAGERAHVNLILQAPPRPPSPPRKPPSPILNIQHSYMLGESVTEHAVDEFEEIMDGPDVAKVTEHEDETQMYHEETITKTQFYELEAVKHVQTGEILTFVEAVRQGLLDLHSGSGEFYDMVSDSKISLEEAVQRGYISQSLTDCLQMQYGLKDPHTKEDLTLLQAIQTGLYDPDSRQLRDPDTGEILGMYDSVKKGILSFENVHQLVKMGVLKLPPIELENAIDQNVINVETGQFTGRYSRETLPLKDALRHGYISIGAQATLALGMSLSDCIQNRFINAANGEFSDKNSDSKFTLREAVSKAMNLIDMQTKEVVNTNERTRVPVNQALVRNIINARQGNYTDLQQHQSMTLKEAFDNDLIHKALTLKEIEVKELIDSQGRFIDAGTKKRMTLLEAISDGLVDPSVRHINDPEHGDIISVGEALERGLLAPDGKFIHPESQTQISIHEAAMKGWLTSPMQHSIFEIKGVRNTKTGQYGSFNEGVQEGIIIPSSKRIVDLKTGESVVLPDAAEKGLIDPSLHQALSTVLDLVNYEQQSQISVFDAVCQDIIDPKKGVFVDKRYNQELSAAGAYEAGLIKLKSAMVLHAILNVNPTLVPSERTVKPAKRRIKRPGLSDDAEEQVKMTLADAMKQGLIDSRSQRFKQGNQEMSLHDAINQGLVDATNEWIIPSKAAGSGPTIQESTTESISETSQVLAPKVYPDKHLEESVTTVKRQRVTETTAIGGPGGVSMYRAVTGSKGALELPVDGLHIYDAERQGIVDLDTGFINPPESEKHLTLEEGFEMGILSSKAVTVTDPTTRARLSIEEAFQKNVLDQCGHVSHNGKFLTFRQAISEGVVRVDAELPATLNQSKKIIQFGGIGQGPMTTFVPVGNATFEESESSWAFDGSTGEVVDGFTGQRMSLEEAIAKEKIPKEQLRVKDTLTQRELTYADACKFGIIDPERNYYVDKRDGRRYSLQDASTQGHIFVTGGVPENASDAVQTTMRQQTIKRVMAKEAVMTGPAAFSDRSLQSITDLGWYDTRTGTFTHPDTKKQMTLKEAIIKGLFNPYASSVTDISGKELSLLDAIQSGIIDAEAGMIRDPQTGENLDLKTACSKGIIKSGIVAETLEGAIASGRLDLPTASLASPSGSESMPLHDAISQGHIDANSIIVVHPITKKELSYYEAKKEKLLDMSHGLLLKHGTGEAISFGQALTSGLIIPVKYGKALVQSTSSSRSMTAPAAPQTKHNIPKFGSSHGTVVKRHLGAGGLREELVDLGGGKQVMVKVLKSEDGVERGEYIDPNTGMKFTIQLHGDPYVTQTKTTVKSTAQVQSVELEPHAELVGIDKVRDLRTGRVMSLKDAQRAGLAKVDKKGKQITKTYAVFRSDISRALNEGIVDPTTNERISLEDAIKSKLVDIKSLSYVHPNSGESFNFTQAANMGLMDVTLAEVLPKGVCNPASGEKLYMDQAIDMGIINPRSGEVTNPFNKERITWVDVLKPVYMSMTMDGVYDPRKGYAIPVPSAFNEGILDASGIYCNPITHDKLALADACEKGLIDEDTYKIITREAITDWRSGRKISLMKAVGSGMIDPLNRTVQLSRDVSTPIGRAVFEGKFPKDVGDKMKRVDKLNFAEALSKGLIDVAANQFMDPDTGKRMTIAQALEQGYIDTGSVESQEGNDDKNLAYVIDSDEFDANSGRIRDPKSNLYLTFRQAVDQGLIDADSLVHDVDSGRTMTLGEACGTGTIDYNGKYIDNNTGLKVNLKDAVTAGLIALIASPMQAGHAVSEAMKRRDAEGFKFKMETPEREKKEPSGRSSIISETITSMKYSPRRTEPSIGIKVHTDSSSSTDRLQMLLDDPQALADKQYEFLQNMETKNFDTNQQLIEDPSLKRQVSAKEAVESGLLDVLSGEIVHPSTGQRFSIPKAVHLKLISPETAKSVMENLNLSLEDLHSTLSMLSPRSDASPRSTSTSAVSPTAGFSYTRDREVNWKGTPAELRANKGNLTAYTKISGSRDGGPQTADYEFDTYSPDVDDEVNSDDDVSSVCSDLQPSNIIC